jgi:hypothetical protein
VASQQNVEREKEYALAARLLARREAELSSIKRDLHDRLGPLLFAIGVNVKWVSSHGAADNEPQRARLQETTQLVEDAIQEARRLSSDLRSDTLNWGSLGLEEALSEYAAALEEQARIPIHFISGLLEEDALDPEVASHIYHIASEALTNAVRHASATSVTLTLEREAEALRLSVKDNGTGFALDAVSVGHALGLKEMHARTQLIGGVLDIDSTPGAGAAITLRAPLTRGA